MRNFCLYVFFLTAVAIGHGQAVAVPSALETEPVPHADDAADDACFWVHPSDPEQSTIIGTDKKGGMAVYGIDGKEIQYLPAGKLNNVDIRYGFALAGTRTDIVVASNRTDASLTVFRVDPAARMLHVAGAIKTGMKSVYGLCMYRSEKTGLYYAFVNSEDGDVRQWKLVETPGAKVGGELVRSFSVGGQTEGCVADDDTGAFYIGEEEKGIWRYGAEPESDSNRKLVDSATPDGHVVADVEGLALYYGAGMKGYLIASSQGDSTFAVYDREEGNRYLGSFQVAASDTIDAVSGTDGIDVLSAPFGGPFSQGVFVTQDDANDGANQNFKLVQWQQIAERMTPPLIVDTSRSPRP